VCRRLKMGRSRRVALTRCPWRRGPPSTRRGRRHGGPAPHGAGCGRVRAREHGARRRGRGIPAAAARRRPQRARAEPAETQTAPGGEGQRRARPCRDGRAAGRPRHCVDDPAADRRAGVNARRPDRAAGRVPRCVTGDGAATRRLTAPCSTLHRVCAAGSCQGRMALCGLLRRPLRGALLVRCELCLSDCCRALALTRRALAPTTAAHATQGVLGRAPRRGARAGPGAAPSRQNRWRAPRRYDGAPVCAAPLPAPPHCVPARTRLPQRCP